MEGTPKVRYQRRPVEPVEDFIIAIGESEGCTICGAVSATNIKSAKYGFVRCDQHKPVPGMWMDVAVRQFKRTGKTDWDAAPSPAPVAKDRFKIVGKSEPCTICGFRTGANVKNIERDYVLCAFHGAIPPAEIAVAKAQFVERKSTDWDARQSPPQESPEKG
jgi:hypothetical protein